MSSTRKGQALDAKAFPHSEESERAVLAAIFLSPHVLPKVSSRLVVEDFYLDRHQALYSAMLELVEAGTEIDLRTVQARLEDAGTFDQVGGLAYLAGLDLELPDLGRVDVYVELVKERALRCRLIRGATELATRSMDGALDATEALAEGEKLLSGIGGEAVQRGFLPLEAVYEATVSKLEELTAGGLIGIPTGFYDWDRMTQGLVDGNLIIIAGRPGMGKTSLALNVAQNVAIRGGKAVGIFSLEMSHEELGQRVLASEADLPFAGLRAGRLGERQWEKLYDTIKATTASPLYIDDSPNPSLLEIMSKARRLKAEKGLALLIVDYMQLMQAGGKYESRQLEISAISRNLKVLAKELMIPVIALSQLNRATEGRTGDHRPKLADLRESGSIEQDADMVCFIYRDEMYNKDDPDVKGLAELIVSKQRNGPTGSIELVFLGENTTFRSIDTTHVQNRPPF